MASMGTEIIIKHELRPCTVHGKRALFHEWSHVSQIRDAVLRGTVSGVVSDTFGIVEYENGVVERVYPFDIQFLDNKCSEYCFTKDGDA